MIKLRFNLTDVEVDAETVAEAVVKLHQENYSLRYLCLEAQSLTGINLLHADLRNAILDACDFTGANLQNADLAEASIQYAHFEKANLQWANLSHTHAYDSDFDHANLQNASLRKIDAQHASFEFANLINADFGMADLTATRFKHSNLANANLRGAQINWHSPHLVAAILANHCDDNPRKRQIPKEITNNKYWRWNDLLDSNHPDKDWALDTLAHYITTKDGKNALQFFRNL